MTTTGKAINQIFCPSENGDKSCRLAFYLGNRNTWHIPSLALRDDIQGRHRSQEDSNVLVERMALGCHSFASVKVFNKCTYFLLDAPQKELYCPIPDNGNRDARTNDFDSKAHLTSRRGQGLGQPSRLCQQYTKTQGNQRWQRPFVVYLPHRSAIRGCQIIEMRTSNKPFYVIRGFGFCQSRQLLEFLDERIPQSSTVPWLKQLQRTDKMNLCISDLGPISLRFCFNSTGANKGA